MYTYIHMCICTCVHHKYMFSCNAGTNRHINHDNTYDYYLMSVTSATVLESLAVSMPERDCNV